MSSSFRSNRARLAALCAAVTIALAAAPALATPGAPDGHAGHASHEQGAPATAAATGHGHHAPDTAATPAPPAGQRWSTDAPLQDGMGRIRQAVTALEHYQHGHLDQAQAINATRLIDTAVNDMIANCKLAPDADAALHGLLVKFIAGADAVRSGQGTDAAIHDMQLALSQYPAQFDDPTWDVDPED